jgi:hypothetical protein
LEKNPTANMCVKHITQGKIAQNNSSQLICIEYSNHEIHYKDILAKKKKKSLTFSGSFLQNTVPLATKWHLKNLKFVLPLVHNPNKRMCTAEVFHVIT